MQTFTGKVAVVTGAASGIGLALAHRFAAAGMKVVLADIEPAALAEAARAVGASGAETLAVRTDVSQAAEVEALAERARAAFGGVHVLCNNAGVALAGPAWTHTVADWEWLLGVNLWGVIHGVRVFTPLMLEQGGEAHIVNTASMAGLTCAPGMAVYNVSKHAVVALSETLHHDLTMIGASIRVSVLCPGFVKTRILESARNRPNELADTAPPSPEREMREEMARQFLATGLAPSEVAECVFEAIRGEQFYVLPHPEARPRVRDRMMGILEARNPTPLTIENFK